MSSSPSWTRWRSERYVWRAASALNHPNICTIFDIGDADGSPYLVMELLQGETLKDRIVRGALAVKFSFGDNRSDF